MEILVKDLDRFNGFGMFKGTSYEEMQGLKEFLYRECLPMAMEDLAFNG